MDFINGGELFQHLCRESVFDETRTKFYTASLILALESLHNAGIIYRDLKPENVLLKADGPFLSFYFSQFSIGNVVLVDFGQAKAGLDGDNARTSTICGTPGYWAPELLRGYFWNFKSSLNYSRCGLHEKRGLVEFRNYDL